MSEYNVVINEKIVSRLNKRLAEKQGVSSEELQALIQTHVVKHHLFNTARSTKNPDILKKLAEAFELLEFEQQKLWHFPQDYKFHRWFDFPGCECPKIDNQENIGFDRKIYVGSCPIHGYEKT